MSKLRVSEKVSFVGESGKSPKPVMTDVTFVTKYGDIQRWGIPQGDLRGFIF